MSNRDHISLIQIAFAVINTFVISAYCADVHLGIAAAPGCELNFTEFPFHRTGECISGHDVKVNYLESISTTICCRDVLNALTKALARNKVNVTSTEGGIFLPQNQWNTCTDDFSSITSVHPSSCGLGGLYGGNGKKCSDLSVSGLKMQDGTQFEEAVRACSSFNSSYDDQCNNCTGAILRAVGSQLEALQVDGKDHDEELALCTTGIVVAIVAERIDDHSWVEDFYGCLLSLQSFDDGYLRIKSSLFKTVATIGIAVVLVLLILILVKYVTRSKEKKKPRRPFELPIEEKDTWSGLYKFTKEEIERAINHGERKSLGRGSAGHVYKGVLPSGQVVAIKHIHKTSSPDSFEREVKGLSRVRHRHLASLIGCCIDGGDRYLVYEYCPEGNLAQHLLRKDKTLTWKTRVTILRDCAKALRYLHQHIDGCIVHRDIKLTNILLTEKLEPKLSDFGLARLLGIEQSKVFTDVRGTIGYMDPEYMSNAKLTSASDIYSFGIVILQVLTGMRVIDLDLEARDQLTRKATDVSAGLRPLSDVEDPKLKGDFNKADFEALLKIGVLCVPKSSEGRPLIDDICEEMEKALMNVLLDEKKPKDQVNSSMMSMSESVEVVLL